MHVTILALGSYGDVFPFILLGAALREAGCEVRLATFEGFGALAAKYGLEVHGVEGDAAALMQGSGGVALAESGTNVLRMLRGIRESFGAQTEAYGRAFGHAALRETDVIVNQLPGGLYGADLAEKAGLALVHGSVIPMTRTRAFPMMAFPAGAARLPGYNALTYRLAERLVWGMFRKAVNGWRREALGLAPSPYLRSMHLAGVPTLNAFSRHVVPRPADWGKEVQVTGYWTPPQAPYEPPEALRRFVEEGAPPLFVGFGSMTVREPARTGALLLDAARRSGQRVVLHSGWARLANEGPAALAADVLAVDYVPYEWLFPRVAAVVHHGGSGTTAAGVRAGRPGMVVPFLFDQFFWGRRLEALGVGLAPMPFKKLRVEALGEALARLAQDDGLQRRAAALAEKVRQERGLAEAVDVVRGVGAKARDGSLD